MKILSGIAFLLLFNPLLAQEFTAHINWQKDSSLVNNEKNQFVWHFDHAHYPDTNVRIPKYKKTIPVQFSNQSGHIQIKEIITSSLNDKQSAIASGFATDKGALIPKNYSSRDKSFFIFNFYPFLEEDGQYKRIEKIVYEIHLKSPEKHAQLKSTEADNSVLRSGDWFKFKVKETGFYKLTYSDLSEMGFTNLDNISLYGNGGGMLSKHNADPRPVDLNAIPVYISRGGDQVFNEGDYMLMYLEGPTKWVYDESNHFFQQEMHGFSHHTFYFLTTSQGKASSVPSVSLTDAPANVNLSTYDYRAYYEKEKYNLIQSGRKWFSHTFTNNGSKDTTFTIPNLKTSSPVVYKFGLAGRAENGSSFKNYVNNNLVSVLNIPTPPGGITAKYNDFAVVRNIFDTVMVNTNSLNTRLNFEQTSPQDQGYIDYITLNAKANLVFENDYLLFRDISNIDSSNIIAYNLSGVNSSTHVWDVTDINNIQRVNTSETGNTLTFKAPANGVFEFAAVDYNGTFPKPVVDAELDDVGWIDNQNYHGIQSTDMIIVTPPEFVKQSRELADFHEKHDQLNVFVAELQKIYNEYSSGTPDIAAIRDFARDVYQKSGQQLKYLLLFGDGSYNNLSNHPNNTNFIPTYQSVESMDVTDSYVSDDFYGLMDENEGETDGMIDLAVGRLPVKDTLEAQHVLNKIYAYYESMYTEKWQLNLTYIGDDYDNPISNHMEDADLRATDVATEHPEFILNKIYLDAYRQVTTAVGDRYPDANKAIHDALLKGQLMVNYSGHGGERGLAHERIITMESIDTWNNKGKYPVFMTATCELSRYDLVDKNLNRDETTAGEKILLKKDGGAVAMFTTTRVVYKDSNKRLNRKFHQNTFVRDEDGNHRTIGEIIRHTKVDDYISSGNNANTNTLNFSLLGDPAMKLAFTKHVVKTDSINGVSLQEFNDTINALQKVRVSGHIEDHTGQTLDQYNGLLYSTVFDKPKEVKTLNNDGHGSFAFDLQKDILYNGRSSIRNGQFSFEFIVPKDIAFFTGPGKISYYATDSVSNGSGYLDSLMVGGITDVFDQDNQGPEIDLYLNDSTFKSGGITNANPVLYAKVEDISGINTSSYNVGHDIVAYLDDDESNPIILNDYYESAIDSYQKGFITYPMSDLEPGMHTLRLKVWDTHNNASEASIQFNVIGENKFKMSKIFNYPNPFKNNTRFEFEHNMPNQDLKVTIHIYDLAGNKVGILKKNMFTNGFSSQPIYWNGNINGSPIASGMYVYTIEIKNEEGDITSGKGKLIKIR